LPPRTLRPACFLLLPLLPLRFHLRHFLLLLLLLLLLILCHPLLILLFLLCHPLVVHLLHFRLLLHRSAPNPTVHIISRPPPVFFCFCSPCHAHTLLPVHLLHHRSPFLALRPLFSAYLHLLLSFLPSRCRFLFRRLVPQRQFLFLFLRLLRLARKLMFSSQLRPRKRAGDRNTSTTLNSTFLGSSGLPIHTQSRTSTTPCSTMSLQNVCVNASMPVISPSGQLRSFVTSTASHVHVEETSICALAIRLYAVVRFIAGCTVVIVGDARTLLRCQCWVNPSLKVSRSLFSCTCFPLCNLMVSNNSFSRAGQCVSFSLSLSGTNSLEMLLPTVSTLFSISPSKFVKLKAGCHLAWPSVRKLERTLSVIRGKLKQRIDQEIQATMKRGKYSVLIFPGVQASSLFLSTCPSGLISILH